MSKLDLPAIPRSFMFRSIKEEMAVEWQDFFRRLLVRVGGFDALTNLELAAGIIAGNGFGSPTELTIAASAVTVSGIDPWRFHSIDTTGDAATGNLGTINGGNAGEMILLQAENAARTVVVKGWGNLKLQSDFSLNTITDKIMLICISPGVWHEVSRSNNWS